MMNFTKEQIQKAMECKSADELLALAKAEGVELTAEEAEKYFETLQTKELSLDDLDAVAGGTVASPCAGHVEICAGQACAGNC